MVISEYEEREKYLIVENSEMRDCLSAMQKELITMLNEPNTESMQKVSIVILMTHGMYVYSNCMLYISNCTKQYIEISSKNTLNLYPWSTRITYIILYKLSNPNNKTPFKKTKHR